jgi:hypothetical protein
VTDCTYVGGTNSGTNFITNQTASGNGFLYCSGGGNSFALRNFITNNAEEGVQFDSGPVAIAGNTFWSLAINDAACALAPNFLNSATTGSLSPSITFVGNSVVGNAYGACNDASNMAAPYTLNFSGNSLSLLLQPTNPSDLNIYVSSGLSLFGCQNLSVCGNVMSTGGTGVAYITSCSNSVILANNFSAVAYRSILDLGVGSEIDNQTIGNVLGCGNSCHLKAHLSEGQSWFLYNNQYVNTNLNNVLPFTDAGTLWAHITP